MITSLLIDGTEYRQYLLYNEVNKLRFQIDEGINSPVCPTYEFTLDNRDGLEDNFLSNFPYKMFEEGHVQLFYNNTKRFDGYIDKDSSKILKNADDLTIYSVSKDKKIGMQLAGYDVTQLYYNKDGSVPVRQRGGRTGTVRYAYDGYHLIEDLIGTMLDDLGITTRSISYSSQDLDFYLRYRYNEEKFGPIADKQPIGVYRNTGEKAASNPYYNVITRFKRNETDTESYDTLLKEFAKIAGCIFFYNPQNDTFIFDNRNMQYGTSLNIDQLMLYSPDDGSYEIPIKYKNAYNGLILEFDNLSLLLKINIVGGEKVYEYGVDAQQYNIIEIEGTYWLQLDPVYGTDMYKLGPNPFSDCLYIENGLKIKMNGKFSDYYSQEGPTYERVDLFMQALLYNYGHTLMFNKEIEVKLNGCYFPPLIVTMNSDTYPCWYGEIDFNTEETLIKLEVSDFVAE